MNGDTKKKRRLGVNNISLMITVALFIVLVLAGGARYDRFLSLSTLLNLLNNNAHLIITSIGVTFVLLTGGIDISVASTLAFTCVFSAWLFQAGAPAGFVYPLVLAVGGLFGAFMGFLIYRFKLQPFIVTLAGQFFLRGMCAVLTGTNISITNSTHQAISLAKLNLAGDSPWIGNAKLYYYVLVAFVVIFVAFFVLRYTKYGRDVYAVGGSEQSAMLMGLPVRRVKISVYAISGFCASLGGIVYSFMSPAGAPLQNIGLELDAISSAVIGGTLLTGGVGSVIGTVFGVLIQGVIQTIVTYQNLNSWWTRVTLAALLCIFIVIQRIISVRTEKSKLA